MEPKWSKTLRGVKLSDHIRDRKELRRQANAQRNVRVRILHKVAVSGETLNRPLDMRANQTF